MADRKTFARTLRDLARSLWQYLQEVSGERDYARYRARQRGCGEKLLKAGEFYQHQQERKYSHPNRCC